MKPPDCDCRVGGVFENDPNIHQRNTNPKGKSLFAEGEMSFSVADCSGFLQKKTE